MKAIALATLLAAVMTPMHAPAEETTKTAAAPAEKQTLSARLDAIVQEGLDAKVYPGAVLVVGQPGKVLHSKAYGRFTYDETSPEVKLNTIFDMASVSKVVGTATASWKLMEEGKLSPSDPVSKYIPGFDSNGKEGVTVGDLMLHVSGLKAYENNAVVEKTRAADESKADALIRHYAALPASYKPREKYVYSCLNFQTLARVNEVASGQQMEKFLVEKVYGPLGMKDTRYRLSEEQKARTTPTHKSGEDLRVGVIHDPLAQYHGVSEEHCPGNAGVFSTAQDLIPYCEMILNGGTYQGKQVLSPEVVATTTANQMPSAVDSLHGYGWDIYESRPYITDLNKEDGARVIGHTGYTGTLLVLDQKTKTYVILLTNRVFPPAEDGAEGSSEGIKKARREVVDAVFRSLPQYQEYFAAQAKRNEGQPAR